MTFRDEAVYTLLKLVPKNALSRAVGAAVRAPAPAPVTRAVIRGFSALYGVDVSEAERPAAEYSTFGDFFTRRLKAGARAIAPGEAVLASPADGALGQCGAITSGECLQAKGKTYAAAELVGGDADGADYAAGSFATVYLAPHNYHRVHAPLGGTITGFHYAPGQLWPVNRIGVARVEKLFAVNERLTTFLDTPAGRCAVVMVGATCVGRMRALYADVVTNATQKREARRERFERPIPVEKGAELGIFEMGSTVVMLFERQLALEPGLETGAPVRMGQKLGAF